MPNAALLAACTLLSTTALLHPQAPRRPSQLGAKKRDYSAGGLGSSKQEQFARLWRDKDAPVEPPVKDATTWEAEIAAFDAAAELVPDAHWRDKGRAAVVEDVSRKAITSDRSVAVAAWDALRGSDGGPYAADDAWLDMDGPARSLILVGGSAHESTFLPRIVIDAHRSWARSTASTPRRAPCTTACRGRSAASSRSFLRPPRRQKGGSASAARSSVYMMMPGRLQPHAASPWKAPASSCWRRRTRRRTSTRSSRGSRRRSTASRVLSKVPFGTRACFLLLGGPGNG